MVFISQFEIFSKIVAFVWKPQFLTSKSLEPFFKKSIKFQKLKSFSDEESVDKLIEFSQASCNLKEQFQLSFFIIL
ncbi:MAG: hypothetical protein LBF15_02705 [Candidatus Peribacteria bacterium]|jgi:hypothetical protein|nr:hypothetical protein [Candidatus Peribacteria bacterium]